VFPCGRARNEISGRFVEHREVQVHPLHILGRTSSAICIRRRAAVEITVCRFLCPHPENSGWPSCSQVDPPNSAAQDPAAVPTRRVRGSDAVVLSCFRFRRARRTAANRVTPVKHHALHQHLLQVGFGPTLDWECKARKNHTRGIDFRITQASKFEFWTTKTTSPPTKRRGGFRPSPEEEIWRGNE